VVSVAGLHPPHQIVAVWIGCGSRLSLAERSQASKHFFLFFCFTKWPFHWPKQINKSYLFFVGAVENYLMFIDYLSSAKSRQKKPEAIDENFAFRVSRRNQFI
jgi:hypothetical protein